MRIIQAFFFESLIKKYVSEKNMSIGRFVGIALARDFSGTMKVLRKIALIALIVAVIPILGLNVLMPRLAIATGDLQLNIVDLSIVEFTNSSGYPAAGYNRDIQDNATLDFWLEVGLPVKDEDLGNDTTDLRYYNLDGSLNTANLQDSTAEIIIPVIRVVAKYKDNVVGVGGSVCQYVLNKDHPVEYIHLYLTGGRMPDGGLMYLFNALVAEGVLDQLLIGAITGEGELELGALLGGLAMEITAYVGGAPISLAIDASFFGLTALPVIDPASRPIAPAFEMMESNPWIYYAYNKTINNYMDKKDTFARFMHQLGFEDLDPVALFASLGINGIEPLGNMVNQLFDQSPVPFNATTEVVWWIDGDNVTTDALYNQGELNTFMTAEILALAPGIDLSPSEVDINDGVALRAYLEDWAEVHFITNMGTAILNNATSWFTRRHVLADNVLPLNLPVFDYTALDDTFAPLVVYNTYRGQNITISYLRSIENIFVIMGLLDYGLADIFQGLNKEIPAVLNILLFGGLKRDSVTGSLLMFNQTYTMQAPDYSVISPEIGSVPSEGLLIFTIFASFIVLFLLLAITKGTVKINRREFLAREDVSRNVKAFIANVEQLGGKVSVQNAEALAVRAFRTVGTIEKPTDIDKRAKSYVENQKLLVTLQSRASRAYVAQKFKDCIAAIEKMIQIARKLEDQTLVANYEENLAKVVRLLRRKGIAVSTKVRVEEAEKPAEELEQLNIYKKDLLDLQNRASKLFAEKNFNEAKNCIKEMLAIAKKIQDPVLIRNYEANLRKIIAMEKGGSA